MRFDELEEALGRLESLLVIEHAAGGSTPRVIGEGRENVARAGDQFVVAFAFERTGEVAVPGDDLRRVAVHDVVSETGAEKVSAGVGARLSDK